MKTIKVLTLIILYFGLVSCSMFSNTIPISTHTPNLSEKMSKIYW